MITLSHISYPALTFIAVAEVFDIDYSLINILVLMLSANIPDLDFFVYKIFNKGKFDEKFDHHEWITHRPILYLPLILSPIFFRQLNFFLISYGILSHFFLDMFFITKGIAWFYPFSKNKFEFFNKSLKVKSGYEWWSRYRKLFIYKIDMAASALLIIFLLIYCLRSI